MAPVRNLLRRLRSSFGSSADSSDDQAWTRAILNASYDAFIAINAEGRVIDWNPQAEKTFGWKREEVMHQLLHETIIPERHRAAHVRGMKHYFATGKGPVLNRRIEIDACHREGREIPIELIIYPVQQGKETVFGAFLHDISERKRSQQLQRSQLEITSILSEARSLDEAAPILLERICKLLGWSAAEFWLIQNQSDTMKCKSIWVSSAELQGFVDLTYAQAFKRGEGLPGRVWVTGEPALVADVTVDPGFPRKDEALRGGLRGALAFPIKVDDTLVGVMSFYVSGSETPEPQLLELMADIGRRVAHFILRRGAEVELESLNKELETRVSERTTELARANEQLRAANRMKDEFLATVSHELRTPLNVMQGHSELLLGETLSDSSRQSVEAIYRNAKAQGHLISDLLDVSRIISGKMELEAAPVSLAKVVEAALETVDVAAKSKDIHLHVEVDPSIGPVSGDFHRLQQVVWNLLTNAVKFTPKSGSVTVRLEGLDSKARISVSDTGKGIEADFLPHVFERFRQEDASTTRHFGGLGLGLAIARHIAEAHGGQIEVTSPGKDQGSTFSVTLPLLAVQQQTQLPLSEGPESPKGFAQAARLRGVSVLVVDDQDDARAMLKLILGRAGAQVWTAGSSEEAQTVLQSHTPDLIVSDIGMPDESGYTLLKKVRAQTGAARSIPAIALTAYAHPADRAQAIEAGFQRHLAKPVMPGELIETIRQLTTPSP